MNWNKTCTLKLENLEATLSYVGKILQILALQNAHLTCYQCCARQQKILAALASASTLQILIGVVYAASASRLASIPQIKVLSRKNHRLCSRAEKLGIFELSSNALISKQMRHKMIVTFVFFIYLLQFRAGTNKEHKTLITTKHNSTRKKSCIEVNTISRIYSTTWG